MNQNAKTNRRMKKTRGKRMKTKEYQIAPDSNTTSEKTEKPTTTHTHKKLEE